MTKFIFFFYHLLNFVTFSLIIWWSLWLFPDHLMKYIIFLTIILQILITVLINCLSNKIVYFGDSLIIWWNLWFFSCKLSIRFTYFILCMTKAIYFNWSFDKNYDLFWSIIRWYSRLVWFLLWFILLDPLIHFHDFFRHGLIKLSFSVSFWQFFFFFSWIFCRKSQFSCNQ